MNVYIGIDGGGTGTKVSIINDKEEILYLEEGGRSSIDTVDLMESFNNINNILMKYDFTNKKVISVFAGIGGVDSKEDKESLSKLLVNLKGVGTDTLISVDNDVKNALASGLIFEDGITIIAGTGMSVYGVKGNKSHKAGGWGFKEGDAGSSFDLGFQALKIAIRSKDKRIVETEFTKEVSRVIGLVEPNDIIKITNDLHDNRTKVASYAPLVTKHANLKDPYALNIVDIATDELALAFKAVYNTLEFDEVTLVIVGSLGNADGIFKEMLHKKIKEIGNNITITKPKIDPAVAAALLALRMKGSEY